MHLCYCYNVTSNTIIFTGTTQNDEFLVPVYNSRLLNQYSAIVPSIDSEQDNVSNNSKTSNDFSSSLLSELTCEFFYLLEKTEFKNRLATFPRSSYF